MRKRFFFVLLSAFVIVLSACGNSGSQTSYSSGSSPDKKISEKVDASAKSDTTSIQLLTNSDVGDYLADGKGMTLYYFTKDQPNVSNCTGQCLQNWPAIYGDVDHLNVPTGFNKSDFGTITREDTGKQQLTFKGYPLYYYTPDKTKGDIKGQNVGNVWFIVNADTQLTKGQDDGSQSKY